MPIAISVNIYSISSEYTRLIAYSLYNQHMLKLRYEVISVKNSLNVEIGKRVREQRNLMGYTREQFAEALDISERFATDIELGNRGMSFTTLIRVCELLSVSSDYILMGKKESQPLEDTKLNRIAARIDKKYIPLAENMLSTFAKAINMADKK